MSKEPLIFKVDNVLLIPKVEGNKLTIHKRDDIDFDRPVVTIEFKNAVKLREFTRQLCFQSNLEYYMTDVKTPNEISLM